ncbi:MAG: Holliday junction branch migration protein RuvA [Rickettsiales bacterium]|nr:Holliday junction branch migration protein RuvA [Rickettsiales bacterium]|tara:strand:- start:39822 stop:40424 length:603 start_codon:yes stop_codon:yes gene_type:complete
MIAQLTGLFVRGTDQYLILNVGGVGYQVWSPRQTIDQAMTSGGTLTLEVLTVFKQEEMVLYGFIEEADKNLFELLLNVQGVGGKMALALISGLGSSAIIAAIQQQDHTPLTQASGVGPKLAQRITRELKDKAGKLIITESAHGYNSPSPAYGDAQQALVSLGYKSHLITPILKKIISEQPKATVDQLVTIALKHLSQQGR